MTDFDADIDARKAAMYREMYPGEIYFGPPRELTVRTIGDFRTRWDILAAASVFTAGLPVALLLRSIGL